MSMTQQEAAWSQILTSERAAKRSHGKRRAALVDAVDRILRENLARRILPFDSNAAQFFATIAAVRRAAGRPIAQGDCQIASIAHACGPQSPRTIHLISRAAKSTWSTLGPTHEPC